MAMSNIYSIILIQLFVLCTLSIFTLNNVSAQVGEAQACTNFTCRHGECEQLSAGYLCHCYAGIKGEKCDLKMQPGDSLCLSSPCWGGGTCIVSGGDYKCECPPGRTGKNCRTIQTAPCLLQNPCKNNAVCQVVDNQTFCFCVGFWTGKFCETSIELCARPNPCYNGGTCENNRCKCTSNFVGYQCETYNPTVPKKIIKILNKGWYVAELMLTYQVQNGTIKNLIREKKRIALGQRHIFYLPNTVNYDSTEGTILNVKAIWGKSVLATRIRSDPECFHIWGTTLIPFWTRMTCW